MEKISIRTIRAPDNSEIARIIRTSLAEFGLDKPGTVYFDASTDHLFELFQEPKSIYYIALLDQEIVGGAGIYPTHGLSENTCELVKMYLTKKVRGMGLGKLLIAKCLEYGKENGYTQVYLETMPELEKALTVYEKFGFQYLDRPMGDTGHFGCNRWMLKTL
jgi:putative acetyltransferase